MYVTQLQNNKGKVYYFLQRLLYFFENKYFVDSNYLKRGYRCQ